ncbi:uncharacterized protein [Euphorbia lathyris]|uniref:uncharacterized protein n=1 Tax=Euphorbia lathyris TaxID=212925 RepID=UPI0033139670
MEETNVEISTPKDHDFDETTSDNEEHDHDHSTTSDNEEHDWAIHDHDHHLQEEEEEDNASFSSFQSYYACYSLSKIDKSHLEHGDQIIMPESSIHKLLSLQIDFPMLFQISNDSKGRASHCGVYEFTAEEGTVLLPSWMMKNLHLEEGEVISLKSVKLEKGTYVKLQPHSVDFLGILNPKAALEECLSSKFFCLTVGDTILINYNNKDLFIDILQAKPSSAVCILDTDCEVDFAPPLDYKQPPKELKPSNFIPFSGVARRLDGNPVPEKRPANSIFGPSKTQDNISEKPAKTEIPQKKEFQPFTGKKYTLSG